MRINSIANYSTGALLILGSLGAGGQWNSQTSGTRAQLRGVSAVSSTVAWASGSDGTFLRTTDGGVHWIAGTVPDAASLDFRDVHAVDANSAYLMATAGKIYKTADGGAHWALQYNNTAPGVFLDAFDFWDSSHGIALGDPMNGAFLIVKTDNGGNTWTQHASTSLPAAIEGEAAFAASGTCITVEGTNNVWFATGGKSARVFRSSDRGRTWSVAPTPIVSGAASTGVFSIAFKDAHNGIVVGGDYKKPDEANANAALTADGGVTWKLIESARPTGYRSAVAYVPGTSRLMAVGQSGCDYSTDGGTSWTSLGKDGYHCISFAAMSNIAWAAGADGRIASMDASALSRRRR